MGLGSNLGKYTVEQVEQAVPIGSTQASAQGQPVTYWDIANTSGGLANADRLTVHLPTRLRLKDKGHLLPHPPEFALFLWRLIGRVNTLSTLYGQGKAIPAEDVRLLVQLAQDTIQLDHAATDARWQDLPRFSGRQRQWMQFGGLLGSITWQGNPGAFLPFLPILTLGEWMHIGNKSSFGLGKYVLARKPTG